MIALQPGFDFKLPNELAAHEPPEARGLARDDVRLMVSRVNDDVITHTRFSHLPDFLSAGDALVVNTSATINAALDAVRDARDGRASDVILHLSAPLSGERWIVELRRPSAAGNGPLLDAEPGEQLRLPAGGSARLVEPYAADGTTRSTGSVRLWIAALTLPCDALSYTARYGSPIRYAYVPEKWPVWYYQTVFSKEPGSAEMPSAGRAFTRGMLDRLIRDGIRVAPVVLHTGVSSLESDEPPYPERYHVSRMTADMVNSARALGGRVVAVGTTAVRAIESVASDDGNVAAGRGWTDLVITPERGLHAVDAILTGLHAPNATHLSMLEALAHRDHLASAYDQALRDKYLWHEFGDLHLILP
jgi:S-adenosylmethionine:tRNA ribosyltransferase-isomerase